MVTTLSFTPEKNYSHIGLQYFIERYGFFTSRDSGKFTCGGIQAENEDIFFSLINDAVKWDGHSVSRISSESTDVESTLSDFFSGPECKPENINNEYRGKTGNLFHYLGFCLAGGLEHKWKAVSPQKRHRIVRTAFADNYAELLFDAVKRLHSDLNIPLVHVSLWPENRMFGVCLTHDVDELKKTYQWITRPWNLARKRNFSGLYQQYLSLCKKIHGYEPYWTFELLLKMEGDLGVMSSLYFLNETSLVNILDKKTWHHFGRRYNWNDRNVADLIKKLHSNGWEVGLHGSYHSYNDPEKINREKTALEQIIREHVAGGRQHNLNLAIPDTWKYQEDAGLSYDTTLGYNDCIGFRWGTCLPFRPYYQKEKRMLDILEIPLIIEDLPFFRLSDRKSEFLHIVQEVERHQGVLTLLWHHSVLNKHEYPGWGEAYRKIIQHCRQRNAWITSAKEIARWWESRTSMRFTWSFEDPMLKISPSPAEHTHYLTIWLPESMTCINVQNADIMCINKNSVSIRSHMLKSGDFVQIEFGKSDCGT
jgi:hypothetical protein